MIYHLGRGWAVPGGPLLAVAVLAVAPALAEAAWLGFRNDTKSPVIVQGASAGAGGVRRGKPHLLYPGDVSWDRLIQPGNKLITIYEYENNKPNRILFQGTVPALGGDLFFSIQAEVVPTDPKAAAPAPPKVKLVPARPPTPPPR